MNTILKTHGTTVGIHFVGLCEPHNLFIPAGTQLSLMAAERGLLLDSKHLTVLPP